MQHDNTRMPVGVRKVMWTPGKGGENKEIREAPSWNDETVCCQMKCGIITDLCS